VTSVEPMPAGLAAPGKRLWQTVTSKYVCTPAELVLLEEACCGADELARLKRAAQALPPSDLVVEGSTGQLKTHPLFDQILRCRSVQIELLKQLSLPREALRGPKGVPHARAARAG
jgi:hypothetical protein